MKQPDYRSPKFYELLALINQVLEQNNLCAISEADGKIFKSKYNVGNYENTYVWRITDTNYPDLLNASLISKIKRVLSEKFPDLVTAKVIRFGTPIYTTNSLGDPMASITIMITELPDNIISKTDLLSFEAGDSSAVEKCFEIESRMLRRDDDMRDTVTRIEDFAFSIVYEPKLTAAKLVEVSQLKLNHQTAVVTLEVDYKPDFTGIINGHMCNIEGKSTRADINYIDDENGHKLFADYFKKRLESGSLGSIHKADYVLFVLKQTEQVICINSTNLEDNWLAGQL